MKTIKQILPFMLLLLVVIACEDKQSAEPESNGLLGGDNNTDFGTPHKIHVPSLPDDRTWVAFGVIADSHVDASWAGYVPFYGYPYRDTPRYKRNRHSEDAIKIDATNHGCHGIVHLGDIVDANNTQNLIAFRQIWEDDYPGYDGGAIAGADDDDYDAYSLGHKINKSVFPTVGNHDTPPFSDGDKNWNQTASYIRARVKDAPGIISYFGYGAYAWRWGQYFFIQLGLWAGAGYHGQQSQDKLDWLEKFLAVNVGDSNLGVLIFQHYGFDSFSRESRWWTDAQRNLELNILCRRKETSEVANPYNIIGIFSGHTHVRKHKTVTVPGKDKDGNDVTFDNYIMSSCASYTEDQWGFSIVTLKGTQLEIQTKNIHNNVWTNVYKPIKVGL